ncbi:hypothetical protein CC78DRAFT_349950 [Lojkania enalia]|uniref:4'-phosphopantetheinyl transferase domain-containing protein n=1 Tax=Lojkania enalia TaxID=147567 RepID=A0A9P4K594_9PLEO|nr:hypothetical protein CC78DRAFT_349950 [Didymosphaeria enalia]
MPPRPFPLSFKVGTDICQVSRIKNMVRQCYDGIGNSDESTPSGLSRLLSSILTWPERRYFWARFRDAEAVYKNLETVSNYLSGRFAAKEACRKACTHLGSSNGRHSIMILPTIGSTGASTAPRALILRTTLSGYQPKYHSIRDAVAIKLAESNRLFNLDTSHLDGQLCEISISHDGGFATAVAIVPTLPNSWGTEPTNQYMEDIEGSGLQSNKNELEQRTRYDHTVAEIVEALHEECRQELLKSQELLDKNIDNSVALMEQVKAQMTKIDRRYNELKHFVKLQENRDVAEVSHEDCRDQRYIRLKHFVQLQENREKAFLDQTAFREVSKFRKAPQPARDESALSYLDIQRIKGLYGEEQ